MTADSVAVPNEDRDISVVYAEDDERLARLTAQYLASHRVQVTIAPRGDVVVAEVERVRPDVVLLDLMLPGMDGVAVCRELRDRFDVPILMVTARTEEADRVLGLEGGADDYITKPFSSRELLARIRAHARRARGEIGPKTTRIECGHLILDTGARTVTVKGEPVLVTTHEFDLLKVLAERAGRVLGREQLLALVHGSADDAFDRSIDVHISRLRQKLGDDPKSPTLIKTVRGAGYMLALSKTSSPPPAI